MALMKIDVNAVKQKSYATKIYVILTMDIKWAVSAYISGILACDSSKQRNYAFRSSADMRTGRLLVPLNEHTSGIGTTSVVHLNILWVI